jgi:ParB family chromosome partitioning protein
MSKKSLGRGLGALINVDEPETIKNSGLTFLKINDIEPNINQPRKVMNDAKLSELSESIKHHGIVQPIIVNNDGGIFRIVAGERRWRAARLAGLNEIPVIIKGLSDKQAMEVALIENIQREDLNPMEEAEAFERLIKEHEITHEELSNVIGKSRPSITNTLRLLGLCKEVKDMLVEGMLTTGHARALLAINDEELQFKISQQIVEDELSVRETESLISKIGKAKNRKKSIQKYTEYEYIASDLQDVLGTKVKIVNNKNNKGKIMIEYYSETDLERIVDMVSVFKQHGKRFN